MKNKTIVFTALSIFILSILSGCVGQKEITTPQGKVTVNEGATGPSWCKAGTKITATGSQGQGSFEIKGTTTHNGTEVCEADVTTEQGSMTYYFNEKKDYIAMEYKDKDGKVIQEINMVSPIPTNTNP